MKKEIVTYSMLDMFRNCRKKCWWRYEEGVTPIAKAWNLRFGTAVHQVLEVWHTNYNVAETCLAIDELYPQRLFDPEEKRDFHLLYGMMKGYAQRYPAEEFDVICLEKKFLVDIINPDTGAKSRTFCLSGKVDGVIKMKDTGEYYLLEHKTAATIDGGYLEKLWTDFQLRLYVPAIEKELGITITGVLYNILGKTRIRQRQGETDTEYEARKAASKTGKIKRKVAEDDFDFNERLEEFYSKPEAFHREKIYIDRGAERLLQAEVWELTQNILLARRTGIWYQNSTFCFHWNRACSYFPLCRSNGKHQFLLESGVDYEIKAPHEELREAEPAF